MHHPIRPKSLTLQQLSELMAPDSTDTLLVSPPLLDTFDAMQKAGYEIGQPTQVPLTEPRPGHTGWAVEIINRNASCVGSICFFVPTKSSPRSNP